MKITIMTLFLSAHLSSSIFASECNCADLLKRIEQLEKAVFEGGGLKVEDRSQPSTPQMDEGTKKGVFETLKKYKKRREEDQKYLEELMNED